MVLSIHNKIIEKLYNDLIQNNATIFNIIGEKGIGKQIIVDALLELLIEGWDFHFISSNEIQKVDRFSIKTKKRHEFFPINSISFKFGIMTIGSSLRFQEVDSIFNDIEKQFIKEINNDTGKSLVIINNYDELEECAKKFTNTLLFSNEIFKKKNIRFIVTSKKIISDSFENIFIKPLSIDDVNELILQITNEKNICSQKILDLSKGNYELAKNLINYGCDNESVLEKILNKRIIDVQKKVSFLSIDEIYEICIYGSYFLKGFTLKQISMLYNKEYTFDQLFKLFVNLNKIGIVNSSNQEMINYDIVEFKEILKNKNYDLSILYLQKFYEFYTNNYDDLYWERLEYLLELNNRDANKNYISKITGLIFINAILNIYNRTLLTNDMLDNFLYNITSRINHQYQFPNKIYAILVKLINNKLTYSYLKEINFQCDDILIKTEILRLSLNLLHKEFSSSELMNQLINEAIELIESNIDLKYETYAALRLQDSIIGQLQNRSTLFLKLTNELRKYNLLINSYKVKNHEIYSYYNNLKYRRATLYEKCDTAIHQIQDAIAFNNEQNNIYELYKCYVNLLGLFIITDNEGTRKCKKLCDDIDLLIKNNTECHFDKPYKLSNNLLLVNFKSAIEKSNNENDYIDIVKFYCTKFEKLYLDSQSNVVRLNYISLMTQIDPQKGLELVDAFLKENGDLHNRDSFYIYNLNNLKMIIYIMNKKWSEAILLLNYLNKIDIPHYNLNDVYYKKRIEAFKIIIDNKIICDSIRQYNNIIQNTLINLDINCDYFNGLDESWNFFSKAFILSDLQYYD